MSAARPCYLEWHHLAANVAHLVGLLERLPQAEHVQDGAELVLHPLRYHFFPLGILTDGMIVEMQMLSWFS